MEAGNATAEGKHLEEENLNGLGYKGQGERVWRRKELKNDVENCILWSSGPQGELQTITAMQ